MQRVILDWIPEQGKKKTTNTLKDIIEILGEI